MIRTHCHCGAVTIEIPHPPETLTDCSCSICRRYGVLWGYFERGQVRITAAPGATQAYAWDKKTLQFVELCNYVRR